MLRAVRLLGREVWWWLSGMFRLAGRRAGLVLAVAAVALFLLWGDPQWVPFGLLMGAVLGVALWCRLAPMSYRRWVVEPAWRRQLARSVRRSWPMMMESCGLARRVPTAAGAGVGGAPGVQLPSLRRLGWRSGRLVAAPGLLVGQTVDDVQEAAERLRVAVGAYRVRVVSNDAATACEVVWLFGDRLAAPFNAELPDRDAGVQLESALLGVTEDGDPWRLDLRASTLVAGSTGSGKASVMWGLMLALAPGIRAGLVEVAGIDLKGGMELAMGRGLFTRYATTIEEAVAVLEDTAAALQARARVIAGLVRTHQPTPTDPLQVVLVDELAALIGYVTDRDLLRRAEAALQIVLSQGRAPGFYVFGFVQDPRKETIKMRHLFAQSFGLRLRDREEVAMVLGDGALHAGAACHKISRATPGVGYIVAEDGQVPRVRAGYVPDAMIRDLARRFPAPRQITSTIPEHDTSPSRATATRRPRTRSDNPAKEPAA